MIYYLLPYRGSIDYNLLTEKIMRAIPILFCQSMEIVFVSYVANNN